MLSQFTRCLLQFGCGTHCIAGRAESVLGCSGIMGLMRQLHAVVSYLGLVVRQTGKVLTSGHVSSEVYWYVLFRAALEIVEDKLVAATVKLLCIVAHGLEA
jgi:hypothetical protein